MLILPGPPREYGQSGRHYKSADDYRDFMHIAVTREGMRRHDRQNLRRDRAWLFQVRTVVS